MIEEGDWEGEDWGEEAWSPELEEAKAAMDAAWEAQNVAAASLETAQG